jgi:hypothetical protein
MIEPYDRREAELEEIVAYLDGELPADESARVERRLASDESYRQQLQSVERAWAALDELPMATVDDRFSRTTLQMAVQVAAEEVQQLTTAMPLVRRRRWLSTALGAAAAAALAFLFFQIIRHDPNRTLVADLPVIDAVDAYSQFENVAALQSIDRELGDELRQMRTGSAHLADRMVRFETIADPSLRHAWLSDLSGGERTALRAKYNRYRELSDDERRKLRELAADVARQPDAGRLQETMLLYQEWLGGLPPAQQFELRTLPPEDRTRTAKEWVERTRDDALLTLTADELKAFTQKVRGPLEELLRSTADGMHDGDRDRRPRGGPPPFPSVGQLRRELTLQFARDVALPGKFQSVVIAALPQHARDPFQQLAPREKIERFMTWMRQAEAIRGNIPQQELERFFAEELDAETRAELLSLSPSEMEQALRQRYRRQPGQGFAGGGQWHSRSESEQRFRRAWNGGPPDRGGDRDGPPPRGPRLDDRRGDDLDGPRPPRDFRPDGPPRDRRPPEGVGEPPGRRGPGPRVDVPRPGDEPHEPAAG